MVHIFIINSDTGTVSFGEQLRQELSQISGLTYFVFSTRKSGDEVTLTELALRLFEDEDIRIYCCGGSGTFRNILNKLEVPGKVQLAFIPRGMTNDFLKVFKEEQTRFSDIRDMIEGDVMDVDYIETNYGKALNAVSFGADSLIISNVDRYRSLGMWMKNLPYVLAVIITMFKLRVRKYDITIDESFLQTNVAEGICGNGSTIGGVIRFSIRPVIDDGKARFVIVPTGKRRILSKMIRKSVDEDSTTVLSQLYHGECKNISIKSTDGLPFTVSLDGELVEIKDELNIKLVRKGLKFVVPKGVKL